MTEPASWTRADHLERITGGRFDLLVIGGGIVGAGVALDAADRGLGVALVEQADFASGASSRSTKLLHGGVRYLPQFRFSLVREGLREQRVLAHTADYLYRPIDFVVPLYRDRSFGDVPRWLARPWILPTALRLGLWTYDTLGARRRRGGRRVGAREALRLVPGLRPEGLRGAYAYRDAVTDDARLTFAVLKAAVGRGATAVNRLGVEQVERVGSAYTATCRDRADGSAVEITAPAVVAVTGSFSPPAPRGRSLIPVRASKGVHLLIDPDAVALGGRAVVLPETDDDRVLFVVPWHGKVMLGTTDTPYEGDLEHPTTDEADAAYLIDHLRRYFDTATVDPIAAWAGLRALVGNSEDSTAKATRKHEFREVSPGYFQVAGGKLTAYRVIAGEATDRVCRHLGLAARSRTARIPVAGAGGTVEQRRRLIEGTAALGLPPDYPDALYDRFGTEAVAVIDAIEARPEWARLMAGGWSPAEAAHAVRHEAATTAADFALRRTRLALLTSDHGRSQVGEIVSVMGAELGWNGERRREEAERFERDLADEGL